jgi:hypothetical protein
MTYKRASFNAYVYMVQIVLAKVHEPCQVQKLKFLRCFRVFGMSFVLL